jgi:hypothetical protein
MKYVMRAPSASGRMILRNSNHEQLISLKSRCLLESSVLETKDDFDSDFQQRLRDLALALCSFTSSNTTFPAALT